MIVYRDGNETVVCDACHETGAIGTTEAPKDWISAPARVATVHVCDACATSDDAILPRLVKHAGGPPQR